MTWSIDPPIETRGGMICAISERTCRLTAFGGTLLGFGEKRPSIVLLLSDGLVAGWDLAGRKIEPAEIERRYPGALDMLRNTQ